MEDYRVVVIPTWAYRDPLVRSAHAALLDAMTVAAPWADTPPAIRHAIICDDGFAYGPMPPRRARRRSDPNRHRSGCKGACCKVAV